MKQRQDVHQDSHKESSGHPRNINYGKWWTWCSCCFWSRFFACAVRVRQVRLHRCRPGGSFLRAGFFWIPLGWSNWRENGIKSGFLLFFGATQNCSNHRFASAPSSSDPSTFHSLARYLTNRLLGFILFPFPFLILILFLSLLAFFSRLEFYQCKNAQGFQIQHSASSTICLQGNWGQIQIENNPAAHPSKSRRLLQTMYV